MQLFDPRNFSALSRWWSLSFMAFGILSLSSMAGMSLGAGFFFSVSLCVLALRWKQGGETALLALIRHPLVLATLVFFLVSAFSLAVAWFFPPLGMEGGGFRELKKFHHFLYPPLVALALLQMGSTPQRHWFWKVWASMGIFCALLAVIQFFGSDLFPSSWLEHRFFRPIAVSGRFHGQGLMFFHLSFASCLTFVAAAGLARVLWPLEDDSRAEKIFWLFVALAGFLAVFFSYSRIGLAALFGIGTLLFFLKNPKAGLVAFLIFSLMGFLAWKTIPTLRDRFQQSTGGNLERILLWKSAWEMFLDRPLTGFGMGRSGNFTPIYAEKILGRKPHFTSHAHNNYLDTLASTGLLGFLGFFAWWMVLFLSAWRSFRQGKEKWLAAAALAGILGFHINGLTQVNFWDGKSQHSLMLWAGVIMALSLERKAKKHEERK